MTHFIDTHCHLDFDAFEGDLPDIVKGSFNAGVDLIINPGINFASSALAIKLAESYPGKIYAAIGFHPNYGIEWDENSRTALFTLAKNGHVVAIGEIGLDYYREYTPHPLQRKIFRYQLQMAQELELPVLIHNRDADEDLIPILKDWYLALPTDSKLKAYPGVLHSFSATLNIARQVMEMNFMIGITGPVTFKNANERKSLVAAIPVERMLLETDAPYLTPHPHRGRRNLPEYIPLIAAEVASLHQRDIEEIGAITTQNAKALFRV